MRTFGKLGGFLTEALSRANISLRGQKVYTLTEADLDRIVKIVTDKGKMEKLQALHQELLGDLRAFASIMKCFGINAGYSVEVKDGVITRIYNPELALFDSGAKAKFQERFDMEPPEVSLCVAIGQVVIPIEKIEDEDDDLPIYRSVVVPSLCQFEAELEVFSYSNGASVASIKCSGYSEDAAVMKKLKGVKFAGRVKNLREKDPTTGKITDKHTAAHIITSLNSQNEYAKLEAVIGSPNFGGAYVQAIEKMPFGIYPLLGYIQENRTSAKKGTSWVGDVIDTLDAGGNPIRLRIPNRFAESMYSVMVSIVPFTDVNGTTHQPDTDPDTALFTGERGIVFYELTRRESNGETYENAVLAMIDYPVAEGFKPMPEGTKFDHATNQFVKAGGGKVAPVALVDEDDEDFAPITAVVDDEPDADDLELGEADAFKTKMAATVSGGTAVAEAPAKTKAKTAKAAPAPVADDEDGDDEFDMM